MCEFQFMIDGSSKKKKTTINNNNNTIMYNDTLQQFCKTKTQKFK